MTGQNLAASKALHLLHHFCLSQWSRAASRIYGECVAENLAFRRVMKRLNVSQEELARRIREDGRDTAGCNRAMVDRWLRGVTKCPQPRYLRALERVTGLSAASLGFADEYLPNHEPPLDDGMLSGGVEADAAAMEGFRKADLRVGGGNLYETVVHYLKMRVAPRLIVATGSRAVFTPAAAISDMAGWMAHDAGRNQVARQHFARALDLVSVSNDRQVTAHILASTGHLAHHLNEPHEAIRASRAGLGALASGPRNPGLEAHLLAIEARGFAALREPGDAVRCLSLAEKALQADYGEPRSEWVNSFDEGSFANEAARCTLQLGQLSEAQRQAERVMALRPPGRPRSRAFGMFVRANVLIASRKPDEASAVALEILQETDGLGSLIVVEQLMELQRLLQPYQSNAAVAEYLSRLGLVLRERHFLQAMKDVT
jgi:hypothetical protein